MNILLKLAIVFFSIFLITSCSSSNDDLGYVSSDQSIMQDSENNEEETDDSGSFISFEYEFTNGTKVPINFGIFDIIIMFIGLLIFVGIPVFILVRKAKELGINDMSFDGDYAMPSTADQTSAKPLLKQINVDQSEIPFMDRIPEISEAEPSLSAIPSPPPKNQQSKNVPPPKLEKSTSATKSSDSDYFYLAIRTLRSRSIITEQLNEFSLPVAPNGIVFRDARKREILILPRFETHETMMYVTSYYHEVYVCSKDGDLVLCSKTT